MNPKLKMALLHRFREKGFVTPVAIGLGLVMILAAVTMVLRAQGDRTAATAQTATNNGLSATEVGLARYQALINTYRAIAMYPACVGTWDSAGICPDTGTTKSWKNATQLTELTSACSSGNPTTTVSAQASRGWQNVNGTNTTDGQFRLIDYTYSGTPGTTGGTGTLTVEGRVNVTGTNAGDKTPNTATSRLTVTIPVVNQPFTQKIPGLWINDNSSSSSMGNNQVNGSVLINSCPPNNTTIDNDNIVTGSGKVEVSKDLPFPETPDLPATGQLNVLTDPNDIFTTLPRTGDVVGSDGKYHYLVSQLVASGNTSIKVTPGRKVAIYVQGAIDISGNPSFNSTTDSDRYPNSLLIYGNSYRRKDDGTILRESDITYPATNPATSPPVTKYGPPAAVFLPYGTNPATATSTQTGYATGCSSMIAIPAGLTDPPDSGAYDHWDNQNNQQASCPSLTVKTSGNGNITAMILAADGVGSVNGGGGSCNSGSPPSGPFVGGVFLKRYNNTSNTSNVVICAYGNLSQFASTSSKPNPTIPYLQGWQRQEAGQ